MTQRQARELFDLFRQIGRLVHVTNQETSLTKAEFFLLNELYDGKTANVTSLADKLGVSKTTASKLIRSAEKKQYVGRVTDPKDKRITYIQLTARGKELARRCIVFNKKRLAEIVGRIGEADTRELIRILTQIVKKGEKE